MTDFCPGANHEKQTPITLFSLVQRGEASVFTAADQIDPMSGRLLRKAAASGVEVMAYRSRVATVQVLADRQAQVDC